MKNLILTLIAIMLVMLVVPFAVIYQLIRNLFVVRDYFYRFALSLDQLGNVTCESLFNDAFIKRNSNHKFGKPDETISSVIGKNKKNNTLTFLGKALDWFLDKLDKNHSINAIEHDE